MTQLSGIQRGLIVALAVIILIAVGVGIYWSRVPARFDVSEWTNYVAEREGEQIVVGYTTTTSLLRIAETLLEKPGGYLSNDVMPPSVWLDNIPNWEFGALVQLRDFSRALRKDFSRSQSQSVEDGDLAIAEPQFNFDNSSWILPTSEGEYRKGIDALKQYRSRLSNKEVSDAQFFARADNLSNWLADVETRLGSLSQRLSASVTRTRLNTDLAGEAEAAQATPAPSQVAVKTPWSEIDDVFFEARGSAWALIHLLEAIESDFGETLAKKNATVSVRQIVRELEGTQSSIKSPIILNGGGFGLFANHSLVMASYVARANAAIIDLRELLSQG